MTPFTEIELVQVACQSLQITTSYFYKNNRSSGVLIQQTLRSGLRACYKTNKPTHPPPPPQLISPITLPRFVFLVPIHSSGALSTIFMSTINGSGPQFNSVRHLLLTLKKLPKIKALMIKI